MEYLFVSDGYEISNFTVSLTSIYNNIIMFLTVLWPRLKFKTHQCTVRNDRFFHTKDEIPKRRIN